MATGYQGSFGPEAPNDPVGSFLHWAWYGNAPGAGLGAVPGQLLSMFNPTTRTGALNLASMFVGGPKGDATPQMEALGMHGQFAPYDASVGHPLDRGITHEGPNAGSNGAGIHGLIRRAQGVSPFNRPDPIKAAAARHAIVEKQVAAAFERQQALRAMAARKQMDMHLGSTPMAGNPHDLNPPTDQGMHSDQAAHFFQRQGGHEVLAQRQAALQRLYAQLAHNHRN